MEGVKQIKDITVHYSASGQNGYFMLFTDMPNEPLALRYQGLLPSSVGRTQVTFDIEAYGDIFGKLVQYQAGPYDGGTLQLFSGKIRFRTVGTYLKSGEVWKSQPMTLGSA